MKVSEITVSDLVSYLRLDEGEYSPEELSVLLSAAKAFIVSYTGLGQENIDTHDDFVPVVYILCQDMYDNRTMYVDKSGINRVIETILGMHQINLLPSSDEEEVI